MGKTLHDLAKLMGKRRPDNSINLANVISFLKHPRRVRPNNKPKSQYLKKDLQHALHNSGFSVNTQNPLFQFWYTHVDDIPDEAIPSEWDWRDVKGVNYVNPSRAQASPSLNSK